MGQLKKNFNLIVVALAIASSGIVGCGFKSIEFAKDFTKTLNKAVGEKNRFKLIASGRRVNNKTGASSLVLFDTKRNENGQHSTIAVNVNHDGDVHAQVADFLNLEEADFLIDNGFAEFAEFLRIDEFESCSDETDSFGNTDEVCTTREVRRYIGLATDLVYNKELHGKNTLGMDENNYVEKKFNLSAQLSDRYLFSNEASVNTAEVLLMAEEMTPSQASNTLLQDYVEVNLGYDVSELETKFENRDFDGLADVVQSRTYATPEGMQRLQEDVLEVVTGQ